MQGLVKTVTICQIFEKSVSVKISPVKISHYSYGIRLGTPEKAKPVLKGKIFYTFHKIICEFGYKLCTNQMAPYVAKASYATTNVKPHAQNTHRNFVAMD